MTQYNTPSFMILPIASDHAGFELKQKLVECFQGGYPGVPKLQDFGTYSEDPADYPDFGHKIANLVKNKTYEKGILICGSGNGIAMTANKHAGIRAAICWSAKLAELARHHNDANILVLPARFIDLEEAKECVKTFFSTQFEAGRHQKRVEKIDI